MDWIYGRNVVQVALAPGARRRAHKLAATVGALKVLGSAVPAGLPVDIVASHELEAITGSRDHQGAALQVDAFRHVETAEILRAEIVVVLDEVTDPRNVGAVARSAAAAGAGGLVLPKHRSASVTPAAVRASAGMIDHLPVAQVTNVVGFLKAAKAAGFWVYGAAGGVPTTFWQLDLTGRLVLVFGAEGNGLRPLVARTCDTLAAIPMAVPVESLNVSVAASLFLFEANRQRGSEAGGAPAPRGAP